MLSSLAIRDTGRDGEKRRGQRKKREEEILKYQTTTNSSLAFPITVFTGGDIDVVKVLPLLMKIVTEKTVVVRTKIEQDFLYNFNIPSLLYLFVH